MRYIIKNLEFPDTFKPFKEIRMKNKKGIEIGNLRFIARREVFNKYRNILVKELHLKHFMFSKKDQDQKKNLKWKIIVKK